MARQGGPWPAYDPGHRPSPRPRPQTASKARSCRSAAGLANRSTTSPALRLSSTPSASPTTSSGRTVRLAGPHRARRTGRHRRRDRRKPTAAATSACATTSPTPRASCPAARRPHASPQGRRGPCTPPCPCHRRRAGGHRCRSRHRRNLLNPPHRARQGLLAQPTKKPRPMAGVWGNQLITSATYDATHV